MRTVSSPRALLELIEADRPAVLSVDLFDTLVFRNLVYPIDLFKQQAERIGSLLPGPIPSGEWVKIRKDAEHYLATASGGETTLDAIYERIGKCLRLEETAVFALKNLELTLEDAAIFPNYELIDALKTIRGMGIKIIVTTDTYLPEWFILKILSRFLLFEFSIHCSSTAGAPKRNGAAYRALKHRFSGQRLLHVGDNPAADVKRAGEQGVSALLAKWSRQKWLSSNRSMTGYSEALNIWKTYTPFDSVGMGSAGADRALAWQWSLILADFVAELKTYATEVGATDIWFLSRDCEAIFSAIEENRDVMGDLNCQYVFASRAAWYPIFAVVDPLIFERYLGRAPTEADRQQGGRAIAYLTAQRRQEASCIVMVDVGWKGRLQLALRRALPANVDLKGFYFSLEPRAERETRNNSRCFVSFDKTVFDAVLVEAFMGPAGDSCSGFVNDDDNLISPVFKAQNGDKAPDKYSELLKELLAEIFREWQTGPSLSLAIRRRFRGRVLRELSFYPDVAMVAAFDNWSIGTAIDGSDVGTLRGENAPAAMKILGRRSQLNPWPAGGVSGLRRPEFARRCHYFALWLREYAKQAIRRLRPA